MLQNVLADSGGLTRREMGEASTSCVRPHRAHAVLSFPFVPEAHGLAAPAPGCKRSARCLVTRRAINFQNARSLHGRIN